MAIKYIKKADKTASTDEVETRQRVQDILRTLNKNVMKAFEKYPANLISMKGTLSSPGKKLKQ